MDVSILNGVDWQAVMIALDTITPAHGPRPAQWLPFTDGGAIELAQAKTPPPPTTTPTPLPPADPGKVVTTTIGKGKGALSDFSAWAMFMRADIIVKAVVAVLIFASLWSWAIIFEKILLIRRINRRSDHFEDGFWSGGSVDELYERIGDRPRDPMSAMFAAAMREWNRSSSKENKGEASIKGGIQERIERVMAVVLGREMTRLERYMGFLASVGSTAPFIGLFGTVWGIMNSFQEIAIQKNTNLATVAPGISEALFATALGLVAAIPAVIAYNKLSSDFDRYAHRLEGFSGEFSAIVSRQLDDAAR